MITEIYKCDICGKQVEVVAEGDGELIRDGEPMVYQKPKSGELGEKHIPIVTKTDRGYLVKVSSVTHPMLPEHFIQWIRFEIGGVVTHVQLSPSDNPEYEFVTDIESPDYIATEYCNIHGLWDTTSTL